MSETCDEVGQDRSPSRAAPKRRHRALGFAAISLAVHLGAVGIIVAASTNAWVPRVKVVWLDLDNRLGAPQPKAKRSPPSPKKVVAAHAASTPPVKPLPKPQIKKKKPRKKTRRKKRAKRPKAAKAFSTTKVALRGLTPGDAALMLLVRTDRVRRSPYAKAVRRLLDVFYDQKTFLWEGIDPVRDFDAILIATPNPYRVTRTFLAARHHLSTEAVRHVVSSAGRYGSKTVRWTRGPLGLVGRVPSPPRLRHDPRVVVLRRGLMMLLDPRTQADLLRPQASPKEKSETKRLHDLDDDRSLLERIEKMDTEGGSRPDDPGLLLQAVNLARLVRLPADIPPPLNVQVTVPASAPATVRGVLTFASPLLARRFHTAVKHRLAAASHSIMLRLLGLGGFIDRVVLRRARDRVRVRLRLSAQEVRDLLDMFRSFIPQVRVPGMPPRIRKPPKIPSPTTHGSALKPAASRPSSPKEHR
ncbi:MAG: hypothetical protein KAI47_01420 [Deltaproteobacteria bacterium]|nr:hypothetical protein [Deltaproteobacteria bacterium]